MNKVDYERQLASFVDMKFKQAMVAKADVVKEWQTYTDAYNNEYFELKHKPEYKSNAVSNYIFSIIETMRPIIMDGNPRFEALAYTPEAQQKAEDIEFALSGEFDRENVANKLSSQLINYLVNGNMLFYQPYDAKKKEIKFIPVNAMNFYPDPLATNLDDAEYIIYASYMHVNVLKKLFPKKKEFLIGGDVSYSELTNDNNEKAVQINNQILVCEMWLKDWASIDVDEQAGIEHSYPNGRVIIACPELGLVLSDSENKYNDGKLPFELIKDYDIPFKFWGDGEVKRLLSPQTQMNELNNCIVDNAKATANMPWIIDKNAGIPRGKIVDRPGLIIRKNPGTEVRREQPPSMPTYISNKVLEYKADMEQISGVYDTLKGNSEKGVYTAQGLLALQEAGQARIRLKVKSIELSLGAVGKRWHSRMKQFWTDDEIVRIVGEDGLVNFRTIDKSTLDNDYEIKIKAGSTMSMNKAAMFDLMIRMAQTQAEDGLPMVDRQAVLQYMPGMDSKNILKRFEEYRQAQQQTNELSQGLQETQQIIQELVAEVKGLNQDVARLQSEVDGDKDLAQTEQMKTDSYNEGYTEAESMSVQQQPQQGEIPDNILKQIAELDDAELMELMQVYPELQDMIGGQLELNKQSTGTLLQEEGIPQEGF